MAASLCVVGRVRHLAAHVESAVATRAVAVDREVVVEGGDAVDPEALHHREAGAVDDREVLVGEEPHRSARRRRGRRAVPSRRWRGRHGFRPRSALRSEPPKMVSHRAASDSTSTWSLVTRPPATRQHGFERERGACRACQGREERRGVDEDRQRSRSVWPVMRRCSFQSESPRYLSTLLDMSDRPESPNPKIELMSVLGCSPRSLSTTGGCTRRRRSRARPRASWRAGGHPIERHLSPHHHDGAIIPPSAPDASAVTLLCALRRVTQTQNQSQGALDLRERVGLEHAQAP